MHELGSNAYARAASSFIVALAEDHGSAIVIMLAVWLPFGPLDSFAATQLHRIACDDEARDVGVEVLGDLILGGRDVADQRRHSLVPDLVAVVGSSNHSLVDGPVVLIDWCFLAFAGVVGGLPHRAYISVVSISRLDALVLLADAELRQIPAIDGRESRCPWQGPGKVCRVSSGRPCSAVAAVWRRSL